MFNVVLHILFPRSLPLRYGRCDVAALLPDRQRSALHNSRRLITAESVEAGAQAAASVQPVQGDLVTTSVRLIHQLARDITSSLPLAGHQHSR